MRADALVCALRTGRIDGFPVLAAALARRPDACAIMLSDGPEMELAVEAIRRGARDVQSRPVHAGRLLAALDRGLEHLALAERVVEIEGRLDRRQRREYEEALTGGSPGIRRAREQVAQVAATRATILVEGEEGTGKGVVARALHLGGTRREGAFVRLDCAGLPAELVEAELCGVEAHGRASARQGMLELADGGTLVLAGVEHLPAHAQVLLLRVLQRRTFERVGGTRERRADVRLIATAEADLGEAQRAGKFREDLLRHLAVVRIQLPPLRERREDLPLLADRLLHELAREHGRRPRRLTRGATDRLALHAWPGNVAELKRVLEGMLVTARGRGPLDVSALPAPLRGAAAESRRLDVRVGMTLDEAERALIEATLAHAGGDKPRAAAALGIGLRTLYRKLDGYREA
jgi:DNA-binding NtrC family response regulator